MIRLYLMGVGLLLSTSAIAQVASSTIEQAKEGVSEIKALHQEVSMLSMEAQQSNDSTLIQCVSSKQASVSALKDISEGALQGVMGATNEDRAQYELRKITVALPRVREFTNDAQKCLSSAAGNDQDAESSAEVSFQIADNTGNQYTSEEEASVSSEESYSFDSSNTSVDAGADSINPPPETSPY
jgi:hypothetical protein